MTMDAKRIAELRELCDHATPGPWRAELNRNLGDAPYVTSDEAFSPSGFPPVLLKGIWHSQGDVVFAAAARTVVPELLDALDAAQSDAERLRADALHWRKLAGLVALAHALDDEDGPRYVTLMQEDAVRAEGPTFILDMPYDNFGDGDLGAVVDDAYEHWTSEHMVNPEFRTILLEAVK